MSVSHWAADIFFCCLDMRRMKNIRYKSRRNGGIRRGGGIYGINPAEMTEFGVGGRMYGINPVEVTKFGVGGRM